MNTATFEELNPALYKSLKLQDINIPINCNIFKEKV